MTPARLQQLKQLGEQLAIHHGSQSAGWAILELCQEVELQRVRIEELQMSIGRQPEQD